MDANDRDSFVKRLTVVAEMFGKSLSPALVVLYFDALRDVPTDAVFRALGASCQSCEFFPKPVELRQLALGDSEDATESAWMLLRAAMVRVGGYASLIVDDAALGEAITAMFQTWPIACSQELTSEMWASRRKEFGRVYAVLRQRGLSGSRYLSGQCEMQNSGILDWLRFVPVSRLTGERIRQLSYAEADEARMTLATTANALARIDSEGFDR